MDKSRFSVHWNCIEPDYYFTIYHGTNEIFGIFLLGIQRLGSSSNMLEC